MEYGVVTREMIGAVRSLPGVKRVCNGKGLAACVGCQTVGDGGSQTRRSLCAALSTGLALCSVPWVWHS